jgi:MinD-like ATPase involved in chromosome partitioning or flagellar assembly
MSNEKTNGNDGQWGWSEAQVDDGAGLPGYPANTSVPDGFELPLPSTETSDPWSSTWSDADWAAATSAADEAGASSSGDTGYSPASWRTDDTATIQLKLGDQAWRPAGSPDPVDVVEPAVHVDDTPAALHPATEAGPAAYISEPGTPGPHAEELITARSKAHRQKVKASSGLRRAFGMGPGRAERLERERADRIARPLNGRKTIMVINTKGGGGKTLVTLMLASYLGRYRSGSVLAWDNNETEGTLGMRAPSQSHHRTVVDLLGALPQIANDPNAGTSELEHWVREQRGLNFDVLASADDDEAMRVVGEQEFEDLHTQLSRFYRMIVIDTGNNRLAPNWLAAAKRADMLVFATSLKDDTSVVAAKNLDALVAMGRQDLVRNAVCVISHTSAKGDPGAGVHTREHFEQWVREVVDIPYDPALAPGLHLDPTKIDKRTHESCMEMAAAVVDGL